MKFRIAHKDSIGYFAHVKKGWFNGWERISGFDNNTYICDLYSYPQSNEQECIDIIEKYKKYEEYIHNKRYGKTTFKEYE